MAVAFVLLLVPTSYERSSGRRASCGSVLDPQRGGSCEASNNDRLVVALVVGVLGVGAFIVASRLGESPSGGTSSSTGRAPKQPGTSTRQLDPNPFISFKSGPTEASFKSSRTKAGIGPLDCSECGKEVTEEAKFCPHCGCHFEDPSCPNPNCDVIPSEDHLFCSECGWDLKTET